METFVSSLFLIVACLAAAPVGLLFLEVTAAAAQPRRR